MKNIKTIKAVVEKNKTFLKERYKVKTLRIFGSYARGQSHKQSDIDILVEFAETPDFFEFIRLENFLSNLLGVKVDLVTVKALKPMMKRAVLREAVYV